MFKPHLFTVGLNQTEYEPYTLIGSPITIEPTAVTQANRSADRLQDILVGIIAPQFPVLGLYLFDRPMKNNEGYRFEAIPDALLGVINLFQYTVGFEGWVFAEQHQLNIPIYNREQPLIYGYVVNDDEKVALGNQLIIKLGIEGA